MQERRERTARGYHNGILFSGSRDWASDIDSGIFYAMAQQIQTGSQNATSTVFNRSMISRPRKRSNTMRCVRRCSYGFHHKIWYPRNIAVKLNAISHYVKTTPRFRDLVTLTNHSCLVMVSVRCKQSCAFRKNLLSYCEQIPLQP